MGLNAVVFCDCYRNGGIRAPPPQPELVQVDEDTGQVLLHRNATEADENRFYRWLATSCDHGPFGELVSHRLGNIALIAFLRELFARTPNHFPILLSRVVHNGSHSGDFLGLGDVEKLAQEMESVRILRCANANDEELLRNFETQMLDLIRGAERVRNPIVF